jgi:hypothetical protein
VVPLRLGPELVLGELAGDHVDDPAAHRRGVVGDALVVAAEQGDVHGRLHPVGPVVAEQHPELGAPQLVHLLVPVAQLLGVLDVAVVQGLTGGDDHLLGHVAHPDEVGPQRLGHGDLGVAHPGDLGHVRGEVTHPLQLGDHPQGGHQGAQLTGHRRLPGQQGERPRLDLALLRVDLLVLADHQLGEVDVGLEQRGRAGPHRPGHGLAHLDQVGQDVVQLLPVVLAHREWSHRGRCARPA